MASIAQISIAVKYLPSNVSVMLSGCHGCGKTEWVQNTLASKIWGINKVVVWHPAHAADAGDVTGLPEKVKNERGEVVTKFCPPEWMVQDEPVVLLIDEANRGLKLVQNAIMQLTCNGTYGNVSLPKGSRIVACINPDDSGDYDVGSMDFAQKDRYAWFKFEPTVQETLDYFTEIGLNQRVIDYITDHPSDLDFDHFSKEHASQLEALQTQAENNGGVAVAPSCRSWERVGHTLDNAEKDGALEDSTKRKALLLAIQGLVGTNIAANFSEYLNKERTVNAETVLTADEFTAEYKKMFKKMDAPAASLFFSGVRIWLRQHEDILEKKHAENYMHFIESLKVDIQRALLQEEILPAQDKKETWVSKLVKLCPEIKTLYIKIVKLAKVAG